MSDPGGGVAPPVAAALSTAGFAALAIAGLGVTSVLLDVEVIAVPGLGNVPGAVAMVCSIGGVGAVLATVLRRPRPSYAAAGTTAVVALLAYLVGLVLGAIVTGVDPARAVSAAGAFALSWFALVLVGAALVAGWGAVALVRTGADRPRWPWEHTDPDDE